MLEVKRIGILGFGQIGKAIYKLYDTAHITPMIKDLDKDQFEGELDILNVCVPYVDYNQFQNIVVPVFKDHDPEMIVIHSTVGIGTTEKLSENYPVVHSPVRGVHPDLYGGLMSFVKYVGYENKRKLVAYFIGKHFEKFGMSVELVDGSRNTEAGKLWSTSQYGFNIIIEKHIHEFCEAHDLDFDVVYKGFNETYNSGYADLGKRKYQKYVLDHVPGEISGHCVVPNWEIMAREFGDKMCAIMMDANRYFCEKNSVDDIETGD